MTSPKLALSLAARLADSTVPLPERANLARMIRHSQHARLISALAVAIALSR